MKTTGFDQIVLKTTGFPVNHVAKTTGFGCYGLELWVATNCGRPLPLQNSSGLSLQLKITVPGYRTVGSSFVEINGMFFGQ